MKISILLASYNGEKYIKQQLDSILNQTYENWTLYISDDGSSDSTLKILRDYETRFLKKIIIMPQHEPTKSACKNFIYLLEKVESDLFLFSDQDDVWTKNHIKELVEKYENLMESEKEKPVLIHSDLKVVDMNLNVINESFFSYSLLCKKPVYQNSYFIENNVTGGVMLINNELKKYVFKHSSFLIQNLNKIPMHDQFFALIAYKFGHIYFIEKPLELYRQHTNNVVGAKEVRSIKNYCWKFFKMEKKWYYDSLEFVFFMKNYFYDSFSENERKEIDTYLKLEEINRFSQLFFLKKSGFLKENRKRRFLQYLSILLR